MNTSFANFCVTRCQVIPSVEKAVKRFKSAVTMVTGFCNECFTYSTCAKALAPKEVHYCTLRFKKKHFFPVMSLDIHRESVTFGQGGYISMWRSCTKFLSLFITFNSYLGFSSVAALSRYEKYEGTF